MKNKTNIIFIVGILLFCVQQICFSATIELNDGNVKNVTIISQNDDYIIVDSGVGVNVTYYLDEIYKIDNQIIGLNSQNYTVPKAKIYQDSEEVVDDAVDKSYLPTTVSHPPIQKVNNLQSNKIDSDNKKGQIFSLNEIIKKIMKFNLKNLKNDFPEESAYLSELINKIRILTINYNIAPRYFELFLFGSISLGYIILFLPLMFVAKKTFARPIWLAFIPILQLYLLVRMANKPAYWVLFLFVPIVNIFIFIHIWIEICTIIKKPIFFGMLMVVPGLNYLIMCYLGLSSTKEVTKKVF